MSRPLSCLKSVSECVARVRRRDFSSRANNVIGECSSAAVASSPRRYATTATARRPALAHSQSDFLDDEEVGDDQFQRSAERNFRPESSRERLRRSKEEQPLSYLRERPKADPGPLTEHLHRLFPPLEFPSTVATQMLTHISAPEAWAGHNGRLSFIGRRVLHSYLLLFLQSTSLRLSRVSSPNLNAATYTFDFDLIAYRALYTPLLGEYVGTKWDLARVMLWIPATRTARPEPSTPLSRAFGEGEGRSIQETPGALKSPGLYKVQGTTVEAIIGGIFHQFGGNIAQRVFHTRLLPHILCPGTPFGLHDAFHSAALEMQKRLGGADSLLMSREEADARTRKQRSSLTSTQSALSERSRTSEQQRAIS